MSIFGGIFKRNKATRRTGTGFLGALRRAYEAASVDRLVEGWHGDSNLTAQEIAYALPTIRNRCRELAKNDPAVVRAISMFKNNIVGAKGVQFAAEVKRNGEIDVEASDALENAWLSWASNPEWCDVEGKKDLTEILWRVVENWKREGEAIVEMVNDPSLGNPFNFALMIHRPDQLAVRLNKTLPNGNQILNGVEVNRYGRAVAYHFHADLLASGQYTGDTISVPAEKILHIYEEEHEGQTRGFPVFTPVLRQLKMAHKYDEAELVAAVIDAGRCGNYEASSPADPTEIADPTDSGFNQLVEIGQARITPYGWSYKSDAPSRPNGGYGPYKKALMRLIAGGLGLPYNTWSGDLEGVSYSSIRAGTLEDRNSWKCQQQLLISRILRPMFRRRGGWLDMFLMSGRSPLPFTDAEFLRQADNWLPRTWEWVDPRSDAEAAAIAVAHHWTTDSIVAAEQGRNYFDNINTAKTEADWKVSAGLADEAKTEGAMNE